VTTFIVSVTVLKVIDLMMEQKRNEKHLANLIELGGEKYYV
jgi:hypothetical protein